MERVLSNNKKRYEFKDGFVKGIPIGLGYIPVSFTFGIMVVSGGLPAWLAVFTSVSNLTSAGQFAGIQLILAGTGYIEIALTIFVINMRYMLMSLSLSQKIEQKTSLRQRLIFGFGITDETFAVASVEKKKLTAEYMYGLITAPILGWTAGTAMGALTSGVLSDRLSAAMGIALYAMFIAIIIPPAKKSVPIFMTILEAVVITCILKYVSWFDFISEGFKIIIATIVASGISAVLFPVNDDSDGNAEDFGKNVKTGDGAGEYEEERDDKSVRQEDSSEHSELKSKILKEDIE